MEGSAELARLRQQVEQLEAELNRYRIAQFHPADGKEEGTAQSVVGGMASIAGLAAKVLQLSRTGEIKYVNKAMASYLGGGRDDLLGRKLADVDKQHWGPGLMTRLLEDSVAKGGATMAQEVQFHDRESGEKKYFILKVSAPEGRGQILIEDVTDSRRIEDLFSRYVSPRVIELMKDQREADFLRPKRYQLTVMFADLRGFTSVSEHLQPEEIKQMIDEYLEIGLNNVWEAGGTVDKVVGDEIMALFGAPVRIENHALLAVNTAVTMQKEHLRLRKKWKLQGRPYPPLGIGVNTGDMMVGNIGAQRYMNYTVLGAPVNLASRLCQVAEGGAVVLGPDTFARIQEESKAHAGTITHDIKMRRLGKVRAKGISQEVETYSVEY